jgi:hypothetical protein
MNIKVENFSAIFFSHYFDIIPRTKTSFIYYSLQMTTLFQSGQNTELIKPVANAQTNKYTQRDVADHSDVTSCWIIDYELLTPNPNFSAVLNLY